jgi:hypothetical protein
MINGKIKILIITLTIILCIYLYSKYTNQSEFSYIKSPFDNKSYVVRNLSDKEQAVEHLSKIRYCLDQVVNNLCTKYNIDNIQNNSNSYRNPENFNQSPIGSNDNKNKVIDKNILNGIKRLKKNYNGDVIAESPKNSGSTSYSINKGEKIYLCIRQRDQQDELVDLNTITFVALHELSHLMTKSVGHTEEFWNNFKFILKEAIGDGLYQYQDFRKNPVTYCGTIIADTPL